MKRVGALLLVAMISAGVVSFTGQRAFAHTFGGDESASFLAMVEVIKLQTSLVQSNLNNSTLAEAHADHAAEALTNSTLKEINERNQRLAKELPAALEGLKTAAKSGKSKADVDQIATHLNSLLAETTTIRIEKSQLTNSTVQALVVVNLLNEVEEHYAGAHGIEEEKSNSTSGGSMSMGENSTMSNSTQNTNSTESKGSPNIVDEADYQSAKAFAARTQELYGQIKSKALSNATDAVSKLDKGFSDLVKAVDGKASNDDVDSIIHGEIHPNLMIAYNLQVVPEFPLPLLVLIPVLGAIVAIGRFRMKPSW
jgi:thiamine phosphate synthase YjbQ (UPF0047 family)